MAKIVNVPLEDEEVMAFHQWLALNHIPHSHIPNETWGSTPAMKARAIKMKRMGTSKGFPDLLVFVPVYGIDGDPDAYQMCAVEMKRIKNSRTSQEQKEWLGILSASGVLCAVCKGAGEAIEFIEHIKREING